MKVLVLTLGTRGDVQPFVALARGLTTAGCQTVLAAPARSTFLAESWDLQFAPLHDGWDEAMSDPVVSAAFETNFAGLRGLRLGARAMRRLRPMMNQAMREMAEVAASWRPDLVVSHAHILGHEVAERLGVPVVPACVEPVSVPTSTFPNPMVPFRVPRVLNRASYRATDVWIRGIVGDRNSARWRRDVLGLPPRRGHRDVLRRPDGRPPTVLQAFSPLLLPQPVHYPSWAHTTGFWFLPSATEWTPPRELARFLDAGEPPVYVGFGSLVGTDPERTGCVVAEAIRLSGVRAIVDAARGGIVHVARDDRVLPVSQVPFDWLFPRMAAVVHHGGIGTTAAAMAAGRPQVVCPFMTGQHFYAARMHASGVAPGPQPQAHLSAERLADAIRLAASDRGMDERARVLGQSLRAEDGVGAAVKILKSLV